MEHRPEVSVQFDEQAKIVTVARRDDERLSRALHGLTRALIANMIVGVTEGYEKRLEIQGVGYLAALQGKTLQLRVGLANELQVPIPDGLKITVPDQQHIVIQGIEKQKVGHFAAAVRALRKPDRTKARASASLARPSGASRARRWRNRIANEKPRPVVAGRNRQLRHERQIGKQRKRRGFRVRNRLKHDTTRPRLCVFRSHQNFYAQIVDDAAGKTLASASTLDKDIRESARYGGNKNAAIAVGKTIAQRAIAAGVKEVVFDRREYKYHGRVAAMADAAREPDWCLVESGDCETASGLVC